jgi:hypothetical protein
MNFFRNKTGNSNHKMIDKAQNSPFFKGGYRGIIFKQLLIWTQLQTRRRNLANKAQEKKYSRS